MVMPLNKVQNTYLDKMIDDLIYISLNIDY